MVESSGKTLEQTVAFLKSKSVLESLVKTDFVHEVENAEKIILTSYPRSGNTLVRKTIEQVSGIFTGSDCDLKR